MQLEACCHIWGDDQVWCVLDEGAPFFYIFLTSASKYCSAKEVHGVVELRMRPGHSRPVLTNHLLNFADCNHVWGRARATFYVNICC